MVGGIPFRLVINNTSAWTVAIGAAAALIGALIGTGGLLLAENVRSRRTAATRHIEAMTDFLATSNAWAGFAAGVSTRANTRNPIAAVTHNIDSRLTQNTTILRAYQLNERLWVTASHAIRAATPDEYRAIRRLLTEAGGLQAGDAIPPTYLNAAAALVSVIRAAQAADSRGLLHRLRRAPFRTPAQQAEIDGLPAPAESTSEESSER